MSTIWLETCRGIWKNVINKECIKLEHEIKDGKLFRKQDSQVPKYRILRLQNSNHRSLSLCVNVPTVLLFYLSNIKATERSLTDRRPRHLQVAASSSNILPYISTHPQPILTWMLTVISVVRCDCGGERREWGWVGLEQNTCNKERL